MGDNPGLIYFIGDNSREVINFMG